MHDAVVVYFNGEKNAGLLLAGVAVAAFIAAAIMFRARADLRGFAVTLGVLALVELALGVGLFLRTGPQVNRLLVHLGTDAAGFRAAEAARMTRVQRNFVILEYAELVVICVTALTAVLQKSHPRASGIALGILITVSLLLAFDLLAERRGAEYLAALRKG